MTEDGISIFSKDMQSEKQDSPISVADGEILTSFNASQPWNTDLPIFATDDGISIWANDVQPWNVLSLSSVSASDRMTSFNEVQLEKALDLIFVTDELILMALMFLLPWNCVPISLTPVKISVILSFCTSFSLSFWIELNNGEKTFEV